MPPKTSTTSSGSVNKMQPNPDPSDDLNAKFSVLGVGNDASGTTKVDAGDIGDRKKKIPDETNFGDKAPLDAGGVGRFKNEKVARNFLGSKTKVDAGAVGPAKQKILDKTDLGSKTKVDAGAVGPAKQKILDKTDLVEETKTFDLTHPDGEKAAVQNMLDYKNENKALMKGLGVVAMKGVAKEEALRQLREQNKVKGAEQ